MALNRKDLDTIKAKQRAPKTIHVSAWGGNVLIRVMSGSERDSYEAEIVGTRAGKDRRLNLTNIRAKLVARCLVNDDGSPMFNAASVEDITALGAMDALGLDTIFKACQRINGLTDEDVDELAGNS